MASCHFHSCDAAGGEGDQRLSQLSVLCCLHGVHRSPSSVTPRGEKLSGKSCWSLLPSILWPGEGILDPQKCWSVGIYFHWFGFFWFLGFFSTTVTSCKTWCCKIRRILISWCNLGEKGKLQSCSLQSLVVVLAPKVWPCSSVRPPRTVPCQTIQTLHYLVYGPEGRIKLLLPKTQVEKHHRLLSRAVKTRALWFQLL